MHLSLRALAIATGICLMVAAPAAASEGAPPAPEPEAGAVPAGAWGDASVSEQVIRDDSLFEDDLDGQEAGFPDPFERVNRPLLKFNGVFDRLLLDPLTRGYGFIVPGFMKQGVRNFLGNLHSVPVLANDLFQLEFRDAGVIGLRLVVNTTAGVGGLFDPAKTFLELEPHYSDFGQTLSLVGVGSGPYLMLPLLGPSNVRDTVGIVVDTLLNPTTHLLIPTQLFVTSGGLLMYGGGMGVAVASREERYEQLKALRDSSVDYYAALRNAYYQDRTAMIWDRREHRRRPEAESGPDPAPTPDPIASSP